MRSDGVRVSYPRCTARRSRGRGRGPRSSRPSSPSFSRVSATRTRAPTAGPRLRRAADPRRGARRRIVLRANPSELIAFALTSWVLPGVFVLNLALLIYRLVAIIDAYRVTVWLNALAANRGGRLGRPRLLFNPLSLAGLFAVVLVMAGGHVVVARYDLMALGALNDPCVFITDQSPDSCDQPTRARPTSPARRSRPTPRSTRPTPTDTPPPVQGSDLPNATIPPWDGTDRLNILLIGSDQRPGDGTYNTDTLIVVSIDPTTKQVAMFSLPRDSTTSRCRRARSPTPTAASTRTRSTRSSRRRAAAATSSPGTSKTRGYNALKSVLGNLYGLDIKYFVEVNFTGFKQVVDAVGGVTINVQVPVLDENYPSDTGRSRRVYIPAGHPAHDRRRGPRLRPVPPRLGRLRPRRPPAAGPHLAPRAGRRRVADPADPGPPRRLQGDRQDGHPAGPAGEAGRAREHGRHEEHPLVRVLVSALRDRRSCAPIYKYLPDVTKIRAAVANAFKIDPKLEDTRSALADENGSIWVLDGSGQGKASGIVGYLDYYGLNASAPTTKPDTTGVNGTRIVVYNGAEARPRADDPVPRDEVRHAGRAEDRPDDPGRHRHHDDEPHEDLHPAAGRRRRIG